MLAVEAGPEEAVLAARALVAFTFDGDERVLLVADTVLEGVLDERDEQQRGDGDARGVVGEVGAEAQLVGVAHTHKPGVVVHKLNLLGHRHALVVALVEHVAQDFRQLDDGLLRALRVDVDEGVDVVERVHQEVGIQLVLQVF